MLNINTNVHDHFENDVHDLFHDYNEQFQGLGEKVRIINTHFDPQHPLYQAYHQQQYQNL